MRNIHTTGLALFGLLLGVMSLSFTLAADPPAPELSHRAFMPAVAGDDSSFEPGSSTTTTSTTGTSTSTTTPSPTMVQLGCAGLRSDIKTLSDDAAGFDRTAQATSVNGLLVAERPEGITNATARMAPFESRVVELTATLVGFRRTASGGIDLIISQNEGGQTMLASFPSLNCMTNATAEDKGAMGAARSALLFVCGNAPNSGIFKPLGGKAKIQGVPFWGPQASDPMAGSFTGIELGPVVGFEFDDATSCDADASKTPFPTKTPTPTLQEILINVIPNPGIRQGQLIEINVITVPAILGRTCWWQLWDVNNNPVATGANQQTTADGWARWTYTVPEDMPLGQARVVPGCNNANPTGSARLEVMP